MENFKIILFTTALKKKLRDKLRERGTRSQC